MGNGITRFKHGVLASQAETAYRATVLAPTLAFFFFREELQVTGAVVYQTHLPPTALTCHTVGSYGCSTSDPSPHL